MTIMDSTRNDNMVPTSSSRSTGRPIGWLLIAAIAFLPVQFEVTEQFRFAPTDLFVAGYLCLRLSSLRYVGRAFSSWHLLLFVMIFYGAAVTFIATGAVSSFVFPNKTVGVIQLFAIIIAVLDYARTFGDVLRLVRTLVISTTVFTAASIVILMLQSAGTVELSTINLDASRLSGLLVDPNAMGGLIGTALTLVIVTAAARHPVLTYRATAVAVAILGVGLFFTYSRSAWLGTVPVPTTENPTNQRSSRDFMGNMEHASLL
jgi:hypothetical protein